MQALSHKEYGKLRNLYQSVYAPKTETILEGFTDEDLEFNFTDEYIEEQVEELFFECIEEGYSIDEVEDILTESIESSILLLSEDRYDSAVSASKANAQKPEVKRANRREALRKVGSAVKKVASGLKTGAKAAGKAAQGGIGLAARAVGTAQRAGERVKSAAKSGYERGRHGAGGSSSGSSSSSSSGSSSGSSDEGSSSSAPAPRKRKDGLLKRGLKKLVRGVSKGVSAAAGAVKAGADSITDRARKEQMNYKDFKTIQELYNSIYEPQQVNEENVEELLSEELEIKALEATGLFSEKEIEAIMEAEVIGEADTRPENINSPGHRDRSNEGLSDRQIRMKKFAQKRAQMALKKEEVEAEMSEAMSNYDRARKRAAQRAAARNAARDAGKTGVVPGVGYVTPRRERETYVDSAGVTRHKSGAKMEEVEAVDEGLTGERYKAALKKGKQYSRRVSADPEKRATRGGRGGESDFGAGDRGTGNRSRRRRGLPVGDED